MPDTKAAAGAEKENGRPQNALEKKEQVGKALDKQAEKKEQAEKTVDKKEQIDKTAEKNEQPEKREAGEKFPPLLTQQTEPANAALGEGLTMGELAVRLDTYDDIFSDFDPRPHSRRELSEDLMKELGRRYRENPKGGLELRFYIPASVREPRIEGIIRKRLKEHFEQERQKIRSQIKEHRKKGVRYAAAGFLFLTAELMLTLSTDELWASIAGILLTPAGWFALWTGLEKLVEVPFNLVHQQSFYGKFAKCSYVFASLGAE